MNEKVFELKNVRFSYLGKFPALSGVDLSVEQGSKVAFIGANGSGKSTLLHLLDGLIFADNGSVKFRGGELSETALNDARFSTDFRRAVGLVFQNPDVQLFCPTVREDVAFGYLQLGFEKEGLEKRLNETAAAFGIEALLDRSPHQLSIGEKRKVAIASTFISNPEIVLLDEPTAGLDPATTRHIIDMLVRANEEGKTIITSTHDLHIVEEIADTVHIFSQDKRIIRSGPTEEVLKDTELLTANNLVHIHKHQHKDSAHTHPHTHLDHHA
jgi:cobalt/nickel transport system ATP-binding protein